VVPGLTLLLANCSRGDIVSAENWRLSRLCMCAGAATGLLDRGSLRLASCLAEGWGLGNLEEVEPADLSDDDADSWTLEWGLELVEGLLVRLDVIESRPLLGLVMGRVLEGISEVRTG